MRVEGVLAVLQYTLYREICIKYMVFGLKFGLVSVRVSIV